MAIQQSINNMLGTAGTVAALNEHLAEQKKSTEAINEQKDISKATAKMNALEKSLEFEEKGQALNTELNQTVDALKETALQEHELNQQILSKRNSKGQFMSKKALQEVSDKLTETREQRKRLEIQKDYIGNKINLHKELGNTMADVFNKTLQGGNQ